MSSGVRIGLAIDAVAAYGRGVIRGIVSFCRSTPGWVITVEPLWSFGTLPDIAEWEVDALIVQTFSREFEETVLDLKLPATNVSNFCMESSRLPTVIPDDSAVGVMGANHLASLGFRQLAYCWPGDSRYGMLRLESFRQRVTEMGLDFHECNTAKQHLGDWLTQLPKPAAVLGCNDDWAHRVLNVSRRLGIRVPDQLAVMGVDDDELFNTLVSPSLTSIAVPAQQIGFHAAELLQKLIARKNVGPEPVLLPPLRVISRESTDALSVSDSDVVTAIRYIREHADRPLQVDDVIDQVPLSRRSLERRFQQFVGHSISDEIRRSHIERAKQLLISTDLAMPQVATGSGFTSATRLGIVFRAEMGETPIEFRRRARSGLTHRKS